MKTCCIIGCSSRYVDKDGRSFFKVGRKEWLEIIKQHQPIGENRQIYICDLHFDLNDICKRKKNSSVREGALPNLNTRPQVPIENVDEPVANFPIERNTITHEKGNTSHMEREAVVRGLSSKQQTDLILQVSKLQRTVDKLENIIKMKDNQIAELKKPKKIHNMTIAQSEVIDCLISGMQGKKYPESVRQFCFKQQFYSTAAYEALRLFFNKNLPTMRTMRIWHSSVDGSPGINSSALDTIREEADSYRTKNHYPLHVTLMADEMSIRKQITWNNQTEQFDGFSTVTSSARHEENHNANSQMSQLTTAKDALVFLIVGPNFKIPIAYYFLNGLDSVDRAAITLEVIKCVEECGVKIISFTFDGLHANISVAKILGASFYEKKPYFNSPVYPNQKIYIILDPPHMLKLVRKHLSRTSKLYSRKGLVDWNLLRILAEKQKSGNFNLNNKLTERHIKWHERPMNVRLAAETISNSVADVLEQLKNDGYDEFQDAEATIEFLRIFNDLFDILNFSHKSHANNNYKQAIRNETVETIFPFLGRVESYIQDLKIEVETKKGPVIKPILKSRAKMGFFGFQTDIISLRGIYNDYVKTGPLEAFYTMQFSQDHLETLFSLIRNSLGRNDNPNVIEFSSAFRKLIICHPFTTSMNQNVISNATGILTTPATYRKRVKPIESEEFEVIEINFEQAIEHEIETMEPFDKHMCAYVASRIEDEIRKHSKTGTRICNECINILSQDDRINDELLAMKKEGAAQPCKSTVDIVVFSNVAMNMITSNQKNRLNEVEKTICNNLDMHKLYTKSDFEHSNEDHKEKFVTQVVKAYLTLKSRNIGNRITDEERGPSIRHRLRTQIHLSGQ